MNTDSYCVVLNAGQFDVVLDRFETVLCAESFNEYVKTLSDLPLSLKPATYIKELITGYENDRIITSAYIQGNEQKMSV